MTVRVVVVDDSEVCRDALTMMLVQEGDIEVIGAAASGRSARDVVRRLRPDLVTMDLSLPDEEGLDTVRWLMAEAPVPVLVVTGRSPDGERDLVFEVITAGALDLLRKPSLDDAGGGALLRRTVRELSRVRVVRHLARPSPREGTTLPTPARAGGTRVIAVAASSGGPGAVVRFLTALPATLPVAVAVVQHLPVGFAAAFASYLARATGWPAEVVTRRGPALPRHVYVADDDRHLAVGDGFLEPRDAPAVGGHRPAADVLFATAARARGARAVGVVLSGIGADGTRGLLEVRASGGLTLAQDQASAAVFGMPRAAANAGAAEVVGDPEGLAVALGQRLHEVVR
jgi:two-component system chemotaxis response regulator CheB